jgi:putative membrane protein
MTGLATQSLLAFTGLLAADEDGTGTSGVMSNPIVGAVVYSAIGLVVLTIAIVLMSKLMPLPFWKEIEEDQNTALGIMVGSIVIGISIIIAAAIHG